MGAVVPIVGAGVSLIGGISQANAQNKQAEAQRKAIAVQQQADQLNAELNLLALQNQAQLNKLNDINTAANEAAAYGNRMNQLHMAEITNQLNTDRALAENTASSTIAAAAAAEKAAAAQAEAGQQKTQATQALASAFDKISEQQQMTVAESLKNMGTSERANAIQAILNATASGGENAALKMLTEFVGGGEMADQERAAEMAGLQRSQAQSVAAATGQVADSTAQLQQTKVAIENQNTQNQLLLSNMDARTAAEVNKNAFANERAATDYAYFSAQRTGEVERLARDANLSASKEVTERGATLSAEMAKANSSAVRSSGFIDYVNAGASAYSTYNTLGGRKLF